MTLFLAIVEALKFFMLVYKDIKQAATKTPADIIAEVAAVYKQIRAAKTPTEKSDAAKKLQDLIRG
jgi:hypothetical protein